MISLYSNTSVTEVVDLDAAGGIVRKLEDPVQKDSVTVPDGGYTVVRFTADNPGWWLMHCHLSFHSELGMVALLHVGETTDLPAVPPGFPTCGSFMPSL
ncbi:Mco1p [Halocaridina rubra]|uniref:Mco1p n=1 Tax=Halocaridina rubra TaxID=373956 RepID=A0AAN8XLM3_HALRR